MHIGIDCRLPTYRMGGISQYAIHLIAALSRVGGAGAVHHLSQSQGAADVCTQGRLAFFA
jgi:hypothetical protein